MENRQVNNLDTFIIELHGVVKRPIGNSLILKETVTSLVHLAEAEEIASFVRNTFILAADANGQKIELGDVDIVNLLIVDTADKVAIELGDADNMGFGVGFFGDGGFGGDGNLAIGGLIKGLCVMEGSYKDLYISNTTGAPVKIDMFAVKYKEA